MPAIGSRGIAARKWRTASRALAALARPSDAGNLIASSKRAWGMPGAQCTRSLVCA